MFFSNKGMLHGSCIVKIANLHLNYAELTFLAEGVQVETSVFYYSSNNKYYYNFFND